MNTVEKLFGVLAGVAVVNILFFSPNTPGVFNSVFGGTSKLFGTLTTNHANG